MSRPGVHECLFQTKQFFWHFNKTNLTFQQNYLLDISRAHVVLTAHSITKIILTFFLASIFDLKAHFSFSKKAVFIPQVVAVVFYLRGFCCQLCCLFLMA